MKYLKITNSGKLEAVRGCLSLLTAPFLATMQIIKIMLDFSPQNPLWETLNHESVDVVLNGLVGYEYTGYL